jgi:2-polyprenyl-3-methyl-5-hydroxy-6-metoxy-1,4-benzoquinol methylase
MQDIGPVHRHVARIIVKTARSLPVRSIIDVGCGNGANLAALRAAGFTDLTGIDVSGEAIAAARTRVEQGRFAVVDVSREQFDGKFDFVLSSQVIEHIEDDDAFLARLRAACGGWCFLGTMQGRMRKSEVHIGHLRNYTREGLVEKMTRAQFAVERVIEWGFPFYSPIYRTLIEYAGGQTAELSYGRQDRVLASMLYQLYRLNSSRRGDVLMLLARAV